MSSRWDNLEYTSNVIEDKENYKLKATPIGKKDDDNTLDDEWRKYNREIATSIKSTFKEGNKPTVKKVGVLLDDNKWEENVFGYSWRKTKEEESDLTYKEFMTRLKRFPLADGSGTVNAKKNSTTPIVARKLSESLKKQARVLGQRINQVNTTENPDVISRRFKDIKKPTDSDKKALKKYKANPTLENLTAIRGIIVGDISTNQYNDAIAESVKKTTEYQGIRLANDQAISSRNKKILKDKDKITVEDDEVLVTFWSLSPSHTSHSFDDECEYFADRDDGYGVGSIINEFPLPVSSTHIGCMCSIEIKKLKKITTKQ